MTLWPIADARMTTCTKWRCGPTLLRVQGDELFYAYMVDNQAIVIPETIDAIRALAGTVRAANESIVRTNTALGIDGALK